MNLKNNLLNKNNMRYLIASILVFCVFSCNQREKIQYLPYLDVKNYEVQYSKEQIVIRKNYDSDTEATSCVWNLHKKKDGYYLKGDGNFMLFMSNQREIDTTFLFEYRPKRIVSAKLNDSIFVSALHNILVNETVDLELVYDKNYKILQIRSQHLWVDYLQKGCKRPIDYIPLYIKKPYKRQGGYKE